jgi:hypothetical protein
MPRPKIFIPHLIEPHSSNVRSDPYNHERFQLMFLTGEQDVHYVLMSRDELQKLDRDIQRVLKEPSPISQS